MDHPGAQMEVTLTLEYIEDYDEAWFEMPDLIEEYGSGSDEVIEAEKRLTRGISEDTDAEARSVAIDKLNNVFDETTVTVEDSTVTQSGVKYTVTLQVVFPNIPPSYSLNERKASELSRRFDSFEMIS